MARNNNFDLSIIILNYNVRDLLLDCLDSVFKSKSKDDNWQVIVVDNASEDGSVGAIRGFREKHPEVEFIENKSNLGFAAGNNIGVLRAKAPVILFLNPDTVVLDDAISKSLKFLLSNPDIGALTCRVELPDGRLDYSCHRGFPTPWNSLTYFTGLSKLFPESSFFAGYTASYLNIHKTHEMDSGSGTFLMVRKIAGDQIGWWDNDYFWNGEDIEFFYCLKEKGWKNYFYPEAKIVHYKGSSSGLWSTSALKVDRQVKLKAATHAASAMRIFYRKHYFQKYPPLFRDFVLLGIKMLEHYRKFKIMAGIRYE